MSQSHWIISLFGLEETFKGHLVQPTCLGQWHLPLDQVYQSLIQPELKCFQEWGIHPFSGPPLPVFYHLVIDFKIVFAPAGKELSYELPCSS